jgi:membrane fusion protein, copper/silver efflux system
MKTQLLSIMIVLLMGEGASAQSTTTLPDYLAAYIQLKDALHQGDVAKTKTAATDMKDKIRDTAIDDKKKLESINSSLITISSSDNIEAQRTVFAKLSQYMITILQNNPASGVTIYSDYCAMALKGKGAYWLSMDQEINNNPYMGEKMPHCGTMDEKISK